MHRATILGKLLQNVLKWVSNVHVRVLGIWKLRNFLRFSDLEKMHDERNSAAEEVAKTESYFLAIILLHGYQKFIRAIVGIALSLASDSCGNIMASINKFIHNRFIIKTILSLWSLHILWI